MDLETLAYDGELCPQKSDSFARILEEMTGKAPFRWQIQAAAILEQDCRKTPGFLQAPCGSGKTSIFAVLSRFLRGISLIVVPTSQLAQAHQSKLITSFKFSPSTVVIAKNPDKDDIDARVCAPDQLKIRLKNRDPDIPFVLICTFEAIQKHSAFFYWLGQPNRNGQPKIRQGCWDECQAIEDLSWREAIQEAQGLFNTVLRGDCIKYCVSGTLDQEHKEKIRNTVPGVSMWPELNYMVESFSPQESHSNTYFCVMKQNLKNLLRIVGRQENRPCVIFVETIDEVERLAKQLKSIGRGDHPTWLFEGPPLPAEEMIETLHRGISEGTRALRRTLFGVLYQILICTDVIGAGVDWGDCRSAIHYGTVETGNKLVQHLLRAGRDGRPALCAWLTSVKAGERVARDATLSHWWRELQNRSGKHPGPKQCLVVPLAARYSYRGFTGQCNNCLSCRPTKVDKVCLPESAVSRKRQTRSFLSVKARKQFYDAILWHAGNVQHETGTAVPEWFNRSGWRNFLETLDPWDLIQPNREELPAALLFHNRIIESVQTIKIKKEAASEKARRKSDSNRGEPGLNECVFCGGVVGKRCWKCGIGVCTVVGKDCIGKIEKMLEVKNQHNCLRKPLTTVAEYLATAEAIKQRSARLGSI